MKVAFADFWWKFDEERNFFLDSLKRMSDNVVLTKNIDEADLLIFSCFGNEHKKVNRNATKKVYFTGENLRPPLEDCDFSLTFDYESYEGKNFRLPLWMLQIDWWSTGGYGYTNPQFVIPLNAIESNRLRDKNKKEFCCAVFNRDHTGLRVKTLTELSSYKPVNCFGEPWNNWFYGEDNKLEVISNFKFTLCYENSTSAGYYTEKPIHARTAGCIPIYWSANEYITDFNPKGFVHLNDFDNITSLVERVKEIDNSESLRKQMIDEPVFTQTPDIVPYMDFMQRIINEIR
jgi:hypothetical protein